MNESVQKIPDLEASAPPWEHNPSAWSQRIPICILAALGFIIATYMALYQWRLISDVWDPIFGDQTLRVLDSNVSRLLHRWIGIPDAALGAIAYLGDAIFGLAGSTRRWQYRSVDGYPFWHRHYPARACERNFGWTSVYNSWDMVFSLSGVGDNFAGSYCICL